MTTETGADPWSCGDCGYTEHASIDEVAGARETRTFAEGTRRETVREILVCPECNSDDWHPESVRESILQDN